MSDSRYKTLLSNLPAVAAVVNAFESPEVQVAAFDSLMAALDDHTGFRAEPVAAAGESKGNERGSAKANGKSRLEEEVEHDIVDGGNIHADPETD